MRRKCTGRWVGERQNGQKCQAAHGDRQLDGELVVAGRVDGEPRNEGPQETGYSCRSKEDTE